MNYTQIKKAMENRKDFEHNGTMRGIILNGVYIIKSYATVIAVVVGNKLYMNNKKYSTTTSRQQNMVRCAFHNCQEIDTKPEELQDTYIRVSLVYLNK